MNTFNKDDFQPHIDSAFDVLLPGEEPVPVKLREIREHESGPYAGFSLMFTGGVEHVFRHDTYTLRHPVLGDLQIFIGPVQCGKCDSGAVHYQAVFSALKTEQV